MKTYCIGDLHGMVGLLRRALKWIEDDAKGEKHKVIFLGDYIDRGPDSADVVEIVMKGPAHWIPLRGNHEDMFIAAIESGFFGADEKCRRETLDVFSPETIKSYSYMRGDRMDRHVAWMKELPYFYMDDSRVFVHAGLRPPIFKSNNPIADQNTTDMIWIREDFLNSGYDFGKLIVHGHTPESMRRPTYTGKRLNLDTGAPFKTGRLSVAVWDDSLDNARFYYTSHPRIFQVSKYTAGVLKFNEDKGIWEHEDQALMYCGKCGHEFVASRGSRCDWCQGSARVLEANYNAPESI